VGPGVRVNVRVKVGPGVRVREAVAVGPVCVFVDVGFVGVFDLVEVGVRYVVAVWLDCKDCVEEGMIQSVDVFEAVREGRIVRVLVAVKVGDPLGINVKVSVGEAISMGKGVSVIG